MARAQTVLTESVDKSWFNWYHMTEQVQQLLRLG